MAWGKRWGIQITVAKPGGGGLLADKLLTDKEGVVVLLSKVKAIDYIRNHHERLKAGSPKPIRVKVRAEAL